MLMLFSIPIGIPSPSDMSEVSPEPISPLRSEDEQDILWMLRVAQGDMVAFEQLIEVHQARVVGTISKMLGDDLDAQDLAQLVFLRVWNSAGRYQPTAKFTTWLFKITRNLVFNETRRRKRHPLTSLDDERDGRPLQAADPQAKTPDTTLMDAEMQEAIAQAIESLPELQRMAIILRRYEDMPYEDIAEVLNLSVPAVKSLLFRARTELKEKLKRYLEG